MKKILFIILLFTSPLINIIGQSSFCGVFPPHQASSSHPDSIYYDRFGNSYDLYPSGQSLPSGNISSCQVGHFDLELIGIPSPEENVICQVFYDISQLILRREPLDPCENLEQKVEIRITNNTLPNNVLGSASSVYTPSQRGNGDDCLWILRNRAAKILNGAQLAPGGSAFSGMITLDLSKNNLYDLDEPIDPTQYSFYSIVYHEALHILGIYSTITETGSINNTLSPFDLYLDGPTDPLLSNECDDNCFDIDYSVFTFNGTSYGVPSCSISAGSNGVPVTSGPLSDVNTLSHFADDSEIPCGNSDYLMNSTLKFGEVEYPHADELQILCDLGYKISNMNCDCYLVEREFAPQSYYGWSECCENLFYTCNNEIIIPFNELGCFAHSDKPIEVTDVFKAPFYDEINVELGVDDVTFSYNQGNTEKRAYVSYSLGEECNCLAHNSALVLYFDGPNCQQNNCEYVSPCDNLLCVSDFENNIRLGPTFLGYPFLLGEDNPNSFMQLVDVNGDNKLQVYSVDDAFLLEVNGLNREDCSYTLTFDVNSISHPTAYFSIWYTDQPPCDYNDRKGPNNCGSLVVCETHTYQSECLADLTVNGSQTFSIDISKDQISSEFNYLLFKSNGGPNLEFDNFMLTKNCATEAEFQVVENQCNVFNLLPETGAYVSFNWNVFKEGDLVDNIFIEIGEEGGLFEYQLNDNAEYVIELTVADECGNTSQSSQIVVVNCSNFSGECPEGTNTYVIDASLEGKSHLSDWLNVIPHNPTLFAKEFYNLEFIVNGDLIIDCFSIFYNCNFLFEPGASIIDRSLLFIDGCTLEGCTDLWKGIYVESGHHFSVDNNSMIADAEVAILMGQDARIKIENVDFIRNRVSIQNEGSQVFNLGIKSNTFEGGTLLDGSQSRYAIEIRDMDLFDYTTSFSGQLIRDPAPADYSDFSGFGTTILISESLARMTGLKINDMDSGTGTSIGIDLNNMIHTEISKSEIRNGSIGIDAQEGEVGNFVFNNIEMQNLNTGIYFQADQANLLIDIVNFNDCNIGVWIDQSSFDSEEFATISNCEFTNGTSTQLFVLYSSHVNVIDNNFNPDPTNSVPILRVDGSNHIILDEENTFNVTRDNSLAAIIFYYGSNNSIRNTIVNGSDSQKGKGIRVIGGTNYFVCGNNVQTFHDGIHFYDCDATTKFYHNKMEDAQNWLFIAHQGIGEQAHAGNRWKGSNTLSTINGNEFLVADESRMPINYDDYSLNPELRSTAVSPSNVEFILYPIDNNNSASTSFNCGAMDPYNPVPQDPNDEPCLPDCIGDPPPPMDCEDLVLLVQRIINENVTQIYSTRNHWNLQQMILSWYEDHYFGYLAPDISKECWELIETIVQNFHNENGEDAIVIQQQLKSSIANSRIVSPSSRIMIRNTQNTINDHLTELSNLNNESDSSTVKLLYEEIARENVRLKSQKNNIRLQQSMTYDYVISELTGIVEPYFFTSYHTDMLEIDAELLRIPVSALDQDAVNQISYIATQCPFEVGAPVYKARSYYEQIGGPDIWSYDDDLLCGSGQARFLVKDVKRDFKVFPNPTNSVINIHAPNIENSDFDIKIYGINGSLIKSYNNIEVLDGFQINFDVFEAGIYLMEIYDEEVNKIYHNKIMIIK